MFLGASLVTIHGFSQNLQTFREPKCYWSLILHESISTFYFRTPPWDSSNLSRSGNLVVMWRQYIWVERWFLIVECKWISITTKRSANTHVSFCLFISVPPLLMRLIFVPLYVPRIFVKIILTGWLYRKEVFLVFLRLLLIKNKWFLWPCLW